MALRSALVLAVAVVALLAWRPVLAEDGQPSLPKTSDKVVVDRARVLKRPAFPSEARNQGVSGTVAVRVVVGPDGDVLSARAVAGPEALRTAAVAAVRSWEFTSTDAPDSLAGILLFRFAPGSSYASIVGVADDDTSDDVASDSPAEPKSTVTAPPAATPAPSTAPPPAAKAAPSLRRVNDAALMASAKRRVAPQYPATARSARVEGVVVVEVDVDETGKVTSARAVAGPSMLRDAAVAAARQWTFAPPEGGAKVVGTISFNFKF